MLLEDGKGEGKERAASGISFREDRGLFLESPTNQYEYKRASGGALACLSSPWNSPFVNLLFLSNSQTHPSDMIYMSAADTDADMSNVTSWEMKGAQGEGTLKAEKER